MHIKIRELREERNVTQSELGEVLSCGKSTLSQYENQKREPSLSILCQIADYFGVSVDYLLDRTTNPNLLSGGNITAIKRGGKMDIEKLKTRKKELHLTYDDLAEMTGYSRRAIVNIFKGDTPRPRVDTLEAIEKALGISDTSPLDNAVVLREDELRLLAAYNQLVPAMREYTIEMVEGVTKSVAEDKKDKRA